MKQAAFEGLYIKSSPLDAPDLTFRDKVAAYFKDRPDAWIDGIELEKVGGRYAWRTRVSECRQQLRMTIDWQKRRIATGDGFYLVSEYRYRPDAS